MSKKISLKRKFGGLWARLAVFMAVILMTGMQVKAQVSYLAPVYINSDESQGISGWTTEQQDTYTSVSTSVTTWTDGWYVLDSDVTLSGYYTVNGDVKLILKNGCKLTVSPANFVGQINISGIQISLGKKLTIYAQSTDASVMGAIEATGGKYASGIGYSTGNGVSTNESGILIINGGKITATGSAYQTPGTTDDIYGGGAGIGGGRASTLQKLVINGGVIVAQGATGGAGIGNGGPTGSLYGRNMPIIINGGNITATGGGNTQSSVVGGGAGIGSGGMNYNSSKGSYPCEIRINGGNITANGGEGGAGKGAGIGLGYAKTAPSTGEPKPIYVSTNLLLSADNNNPPTTAIANTGENLYDALKGLQYAKAQPAVCKNTTTNKAYTSVQEAVNAAESDQTVQMIANSQENITIANGKTITLDLNGYVLKGTGSGSVVTVNSSSNFTIKDSGSTTTHYYTVGSDGLWTWIASPTNEQIFGAKAYESLTARPAENAIIAVKGGAITGGNVKNGGGVQNKGTLTMNGGNIIGNNATGAGGGVYSKIASFTMSGGAIAGNTSTSMGGGVYLGHTAVGNTNTFTMTGGSIVSNTASDSSFGGGGVAVDGSANSFTMTNGLIAYNNAPEGGGVTNGGNFTMTGGQIIGNEAYGYGLGGGVEEWGESVITGGVITGNKANTAGGGVYVWTGSSYDGDLTLGGTAEITGNTLTDGTTVNNVYLTTGETITVSTETPIASDASFGVTTETAPTVGNPVAITSNGTTTDIQYFTSDQAYGVIYKDSKLYLAMPVCQIVETGTKYYESLQEGISAAANGQTVQMLANSQENITIAAGKTVTLDLNGKALYATSGSVVTNNGTLTMTDDDNETPHYFTVTSYKNVEYWEFIASPTAEQIAAATDIDSLTARPAVGDIIAVKGGVVAGGTGTSGDQGYYGGGIWNGSNASLTLTGVNIAGGKVSQRGGGIVSYGILHMTDCTVCGNFADYGGGVAIHSASGKEATLDNCRLSFNAIDGSYSCGGGVLNGGNLTTMNNCQIEYNKCNTTSGGAGVFNQSLLTMNNCTVAQNWAKSAGGGVKNARSGTSQITGCIVTSNTSGGGVYNESGTLIITGSEITDNTGYGLYAGGAAVTLGGKVVITGNTVCNLQLPGSKTVTVSTETPLASDANIGVTTATEVTVNNPVNITSNGALTDMQYFHSDNANYSVIYEKNSSSTPVLKLAIPVAQVGEGENAVYYSSVNKALEHIGTEATTIKLLENTTEDVVITDENITLNLNGKTITNSSGNAITVNGGSLAINDDTENIGGVTGNIALNGGTTTINNGKYNGTITKNDAATLNLVGGKYSFDPTQFLTMDYAAKNIGEAPYLYEVVGGDEIVCNDGTHSFTSLQNAVNFQTAAATITMVKDDIENVTIANGKVITLDLNGKVLQGTGSGGVVTVEQGGNLTINDSDATAVHKFTPNAYGLWVLDETSGTKTVYGGCITGGNRSYGGGIYNHWILTLNGGNIVGNSAGSGGGIYTGQSNESGLNGSTLTINGGCIYGNIANSYGGGISVNGRCEVKLLGGEIRYNVGTYGGGVESGWQSTNPYTIGGSMVIADNKDFGANDNNLYVYNDYTFTVGTGDDAPETGMNIGITAEKLASGKVITVSTANGTADYSKYFTADAGTPFIVFADKKDDMKLKITDEVKIILTASPIDGGDVKIYDATTGLEIADPEHIQYGTLVTIKATQNKEWAFKGWFNNDGTMFSGKYEYTFEATENHTLEARFTNEVIWVRIKK